MEIIKFCKLIDQRSKYGKEVLHTQEGRRKFSVPSSETERGLTGRRRSETGYNEKGGRASNKMLMAFDNSDLESLSLKLLAVARLLLGSLF